MTTPSPETVATWWRAGDFDRALPVLRTWGQQLTRRLPADVADDVCATLLVRAWRSPTIPDDPLRWAARVVQNLQHDVRKPVWNRPGRIVSLETDQLASAFPAPDAFIDAEHDAAMVQLARAAIRRLPDVTRRCFVLTVWHGQTSAVVGDALGLSPAAVRMCVTRARRTLARSTRRAARQL